MILPVFPTSGETIKNKMEKQKNPSDIIINVDAPTWTVGNRWTYYIKIQGDFSDTLEFNLIFNELVFTVRTVETNTYNMSISGKVNGELTIRESQIIKGTLQDTTVTGTAEVEKSNIGFKEINAEMKGKISIAGIPVKSFTLDLDLTISPAFSGLVFPIEVNQEYMIPTSNIEGKASISFIQNPIYIDEITGGCQAKCTGKGKQSVAAGTYEAYKIEYENSIKERYYAEEAGNIIKAYGDKDYLIDVYLKSTNYGSQPDAPNKPSRPDGPTNVKPNIEATYTTSTTDPNGDQIYYLFNWGDDSNSGWLGPYDSGQIVTASHSWSRRGTFKVKVKAKDTKGHESPWSESLKVSIPRNKFTSRLFFLEMFNKQSILNRLILITRQ